MVVRAWFEQANCSGLVKTIVIGGLDVVKGPVSPSAVLDLLRTLNPMEGLNKIVSDFISQLMILTGNCSICFLIAVGAIRCGLFIYEARRVESSQSLEAIAWFDSENNLKFMCDDHIATAKKEGQVPITLISHVQKSVQVRTNEPASNWPNDKFLATGSHPWFLLMPIVGQRDQEQVAQNASPPVLGTVFLEFPVETTFPGEEIASLKDLCSQAISSLKSVMKEQQLRAVENDLAEAREQLFTYSRTLEQKIRTRTLELLEQTHVLRAEVTDRIHAQEESARLQVKAETALKVKEQFLATMSHELRTPFNGVMGMIQLLQDTELTTKQREYLTVLTESSKGLLNLLNDILDYTKLESGTLEFQRVPLSIRDICESVINEQFDKAEEKFIDLAYLSENEETDRVIADPLRLRQLIRCYIENAIKFNENRGGYILLTSLMTFLRDEDEESGPKYRLTISCADTGPGISNASTLFQPFSQGDTSMRRLYGGTGLGLAISKRLVELLNGDAWCRSVLGQGSTFYFNMVTL